MTEKGRRARQGEAQPMIHVLEKYAYLEIREEREQEGPHQGREKGIEYGQHSMQRLWHAPLCHCDPLKEGPASFDRQCND